MAKPGRKLDRKNINRRQSYELQERAKRWRCSKLAVILADMLEAEGPSTAESYIVQAKRELRRANREARRGKYLDAVAQARANVENHRERRGVANG